MAETFAEWAGALRRFDLPFGQVLDLEEACGKTGIGLIYQRLVRAEFYVRDVFHVLRQGLIGGGMAPAEAERLLRDRFDAIPLLGNAELACTILLGLFAGVDSAAAAAPGDPAKPYDLGAIFAAFAKLGLPPDSLRQMSYPAFVAMCGAFGREGVQAPTEEEFKDMLQRMLPNG